MNPIAHGLAGQGSFPGGTPVAPGVAAGPASSSGGGFGGGQPLPNERGFIENLRTQAGVVRPGYVMPPPQPRPACAIEQCGAHTEQAYFTIVEVNNPTIATGQAAWYGLRKINVRKALGQEIRVLGVHYYLLPTNPNGTPLNGAATPLAWGDAQGLTAAIVVGVNLPSQLNSWISAPAYIAGIDAIAVSPATSSRVTGANVPRYIVAPIRFPTGTFDQATPNINAGFITLEGDQYPVRAGETLDVALVVGRDAITGTGQFCGFAQVGVVCGHTINDRPFQV